MFFSSDLCISMHHAIKCGLACACMCACVLMCSHIYRRGSSNCHQFWTATRILPQYRPLDAVKAPRGCQNLFPWDCSQPPPPRTLLLLVARQSTARAATRKKDAIIHGGLYHSGRALQAGRLLEISAQWFLPVETISHPLSPPVEVIVSRRVEVLV
jgi:hypothetical protein